MPWLRGSVLIALRTPCVHLLASAPLHHVLATLITTPNWNPRSYLHLNRSLYVLLVSLIREKLSYLVSPWGPLHFDSGLQLLLLFTLKREKKIRQNEKKKNFEWKRVDTMAEISHSTSGYTVLLISVIWETFPNRSKTSLLSILLTEHWAWI